MAKKYLELVWTSQPLGTHPVSTTRIQRPWPNILRRGGSASQSRISRGLLGKNRSQRGDTDQAARCSGTFCRKCQCHLMGFLVGNKWIWRPVPFCCGYIRMHPTFIQRTNMIERCKTQLTHLAVNRDSLSLRTLVFATWVHFTLRNADDLLLALSPQDESSLGLVWPRGLMRFFLRSIGSFCPSWIFRMQTCFMPRNWSSTLCYTMGTETR